MKGSSMRDGYQNYNTELERKLLERARAHVTMEQGIPDNGHVSFMNKFLLIGGIMKWTCANKPLLMSVFQVMLRLFRPHTTTLMFVIRDETSISITIMKISNMQPKA